VLSILVTGVVTGAIYSLIASGLVLTYASTGIFNLGYGAIAFTSGLLFYELNTGLHWNRFLAAAFTVFVFCPILGLVLDRLFFRPLTKASQSTKIVGTVGVLIGLPALAQFIVEEGISGFHWGIPTSENINLVPGVLFTKVHTWHWGSLIVDSNQTLVFGTALVCAVGLWVLSRSVLGLQMRAVVDSSELSALRGVSGVSSLRIATLIGTLLAGVAGVVGAPVLSSLDPQSWTIAVFVASTAVVIGRFASVPQSFGGGIVIGVLMALTFRYVHIAGIDGIDSAVPFVLLLIGLLLLGRTRTRVGGTTNLELAATDWMADLSFFRRILPTTVAMVVLLVWVSFLADDLWASLILRATAFALIFLSITLVTGLGGMISLAQSSFALGAELVAGLLIQRYHVPFGFALVIAVAIAMAMGAIVALPALRLGGTALTLATLALAFLCSSVLFAWSYLTNGDVGWTFSRPLASSLDFSHDRVYAVALLLVNLLVVWLMRNLARSSTGRAIAAVRAAEGAAASIGVSAVSAKLKVFVLSAGLAGIGGVFLGTIDGGVTNSTIGTLDGLTWLTVVVLLGVRRPAAAITGAIVFIGFPEILSGGIHTLGISWGGTQLTQIPAILFGLGAAGLARRPEGAFNDLAERRFRRRAAKRSEPVGPVIPLDVDTEPATTVPAVAARRSDDDRELAVSGLYAGYELVTVLRDVSMSIAPGSLTAVLGANGAGKSTLCKVLAGTIPVSSGSVSWQGEDIGSTPAYRRARRGFLMAPESRGVFPRLTVDDNLRMVLSHAGDRAKVYERFPALASRRNVTAEMLSGGEQQMLAVGALFVHPPKLLVIDEPSLGLAPRIVSQLTDLLVELRELGTTVLVSEEKPGRLLAVADHVVLLSLGRVVWSGPPTELEDTTLRHAYHLDDDTLEGRGVVVKH
jgi:ABC-type branched-subunit amino acid transport system ATPase component/branched-subunit amino acid ABC-type transport system permease component